MIFFSVADGAASTAGSGAAEASSDSVVAALSEGWAVRPPAAKNTRFTTEQKDFLVSMFEYGAYKIKEVEARQKMEALFNNRDEEHLFYKGLVLTAAQIKSFFSTESARRKKRAAVMVVDDTLEEVARATDLGHEGARAKAKPKKARGGKRAQAGAGAKAMNNFGLLTS